VEEIKLSSNIQNATKSFPMQQSCGVNHFIERPNFEAEKKSQTSSQKKNKHLNC
jgi:hypothetical protein